MLRPSKGSNATYIRGVPVDDLSAMTTGQALGKKANGHLGAITVSGGGGSGDPIPVSDDGSQITAALVSLDFTGTGIEAADDGAGNVTVTVNTPALPQIAIEEDDVQVTGDVGTINFEGAGVSTSLLGDKVTVTIPGGGGGGSAISVEDEGSEITDALASLNFTGTGVSASDDGAGNVTVTIISGSGGGSGGLINIEDYAALVSGGNWTTAFANAIGDADGRTIYVPAGEYTVSGGMSIGTKHLHLVGDGDNTIINFPNSTEALMIRPSTSDTTRGWGSTRTCSNFAIVEEDGNYFTTFQVSSTADLVAGDVCMMYTTNNTYLGSNWGSGDGDQLPLGELFMIRRISGSTVHAYHMLYYFRPGSGGTKVTQPLLASNSAPVMRRLSRLRCVVENIAFNCTSDPLNPTGTADVIDVSGLVNPRFQNVTITNPADRGFTVNSCWRPQGRNVHIFHGADLSSNRNYAWNDCGATAWTDLELHGENCRHLYTSDTRRDGESIGHSTQWFRFGAPVNATLRNCKGILGGGGSTFDTHHGSRFTSFINCEAVHPANTWNGNGETYGSGFTSRGHGETYIGCRVIGGSKGYRVDNNQYPAPDQEEHYTQFIGCTFEAGTSPDVTGWNISGGDNDSLGWNHTYLIGCSYKQSQPPYATPSSGSTSYNARFLSLGGSTRAWVIGGHFCDSDAPTRLGANAELHLVGTVWEWMHGTVVGSIFEGSGSGAEVTINGGRFASAGSNVSNWCTNTGVTLRFRGAPPDIELNSGNSLGSASKVVTATSYPS